MYQPPHFRNDALAAQHALIRACPLGLLVTGGGQGLQANALPFLLSSEDGEFGTLRAHLAKADPQRWALAEGDNALVVFQGPDAYVTPSWYETKRQTGKVVPTWNYVMVQARGKPRVIEDSDWLRAQTQSLTERHEQEQPTPWAVSDAPGGFMTSQIKGIVGVEIEIWALDGKWKVSQNRSEADRAGVATGLDARGKPGERMAELVRGGGQS